MTGCNNKKQVFYIHGGSAYSKYETFLESLKQKTIRDLPNIPKLLKWSTTLAEDLAEDFEVFAPSMPNSQNAKYLEWKIWFERYFEYLRDDITLIGWSLGGNFLVKYLLENRLPVTIKALFLIATPFEAEDFDGEDGGDFGFDTSMVGKIAELTDNIFIFHSKDDCIVPYQHSLKYKALLKTAKLITFSDKNHFLVPELPDLINRIRCL